MKVEKIEEAARNALACIDEVHAVFGAPGDYGYNTRRGKALYALYLSAIPLVKATAEPDGAQAHLLQILNEVADERAAQDRQWGGPAHDDKHTSLDWRGELASHVYRLLQTGSTAPADDYAERLIKVAAIAVAARQSWDRLNAGPGESGEVIQTEGAVA